MAPILKRAYGAIVGATDSNKDLSKTSSNINDVLDLGQDNLGLSASKAINVVLLNVVGATLKERKKMTDLSRKQYIKIRSSKGGGLPYSAKLQYDDLVFKLHGEGQLVTLGSTFVALVSIDSLPDLENACDFDLAKRILLGKLKIQKVLLDEHNEDMSMLMNSFTNELFDLQTKCTNNNQSALSLIELWRIAKKNRFDINLNFATEIDSSQFIQPELKQIIIKYVEHKRLLGNRYLFMEKTEMLEQLNNDNETLKKVMENILYSHKKQLLNEFPFDMANALAKFDPYRCMLLRLTDGKLFYDLETIFEGHALDKALPNIRIKFIKSVAALNPVNFCQSLPLISNVYYFVLKSLLEINNYTKKLAGVQNAVEYSSRDLKWDLNIATNQQNSIMYRCYFKQLEMLIDYANHFEPGKLNTKIIYPYAPKIFPNLKNVPHVIYIWFCLVDATMLHIFQDDKQRFNQFSDVLKTFEKGLLNACLRDDFEESVRIVTHNMLELVVHVEQSEFGYHEWNRTILQKQVGFMNHTDFTQYRDIIDVFREYWKQCNETIPSVSAKLQGEYLQSLGNRFIAALLEIVSHALSKKVSVDDITKFFRAFAELLFNLKDLSLEWYVQIRDEEKINMLTRGNIIILNDKNTNCYQVTDVIRYEAREASVSKHYQMEILQKLLECIADLMQLKNWNNNDMLNEHNQLNCTILLLNAITSSLMYLKEQPIYVDFQQYCDETVKPFINVISKSNSLENFNKRISLVKQSFWYIRNQSNVGIEQAMHDYKLNNDNFDEERLLFSFRQYKEQFEFYMGEYSGLESVEQIQQIVHDVKTKIKNTTQRHYSKWDDDFKQKTIPTIIAGLSCVWSIQVSEDVATSGKYLKPHSIQILSILRLLSVDGGKQGVVHHLAQILTGQGKSVVLGLLSAVLALLDHNVITLCYSRYLANRDFQDFEELFYAFSIVSKISYKTFKDMAWEQIRTHSEKAEQYIRKSLGLPYEENVLRDTAPNFSNYVLLIDEVDVFFQDKFYGSTHNPALLPQITGLGKVQQKIWELVQENCSDTRNEIENFIHYSTDCEIKKLKELIAYSGSYKLMNDDGISSKYTNKSLFSDHFDEMITTAKKIHNRNNDAINKKFRLDSKGIITYQNELGEFTSNYYRQYENSFVYFKLRNSNFIQEISGTYNYGYLIINLAFFSFAKLPEQFGLILGVTGTLTGLSSYEQNAIRDNYKITSRSIMPSYFGGCKLKYNEYENFQCLVNETEWRNVIFTRINAIINAHRSVIIFFEDELQINKFKKTFESQIDRLAEVSMNTGANKRDRYIAEAGISRTVTLATREMGRGVDYKSSLSVESNGGVHIIQTFFSLDEKEETQIKGRTARQDNQGSYDLIVCLPHLVALEIIQGIEDIRAIELRILKKQRYDYISNLEKTRKSQLERANEKHFASMQYCNNV